MNNKQAIEQLKSLREFQYKFINEERFVDTEKIKNDIEALDMAIKVLERTALEVPVQEQLNNEFVEKMQKNLPSHFRNIDVSQGSIFYAIVVATINTFQQVSKEL